MSKQKSLQLKKLQEENPFIVSLLRSPSKVINKSDLIDELLRVNKEKTPVKKFNLNEFMERNEKKMENRIVSRYNIVQKKIEDRR